MTATCGKRSALLSGQRSLNAAHAIANIGCHCTHSTHRTHCTHRAHLTHQCHSEPASGDWQHTTLRAGEESRLDVPSIHHGEISHPPRVTSPTTGLRQVRNDSEGHWF